MSGEGEDLIEKFAPNLKKPMPKTMSLSFDQYRAEMAEIRQQAWRDQVYQSWLNDEFDHPSLGTFSEYRAKLQRQARSQQSSAGGSTSEEAGRRSPPIPGRELGRIKKTLKQMTPKEISDLLSAKDDKDHEETDDQPQTGSRPPSIDEAFLVSSESKGVPREDSQNNS